MEEEAEKALLEKMLSKVGDLGLRRRILTLLEYLRIEAGESVLDCGCGEGFYTMLIAGLYDVRVTAFDRDAALLGQAATWLENNDSQVEFIDGDIADGLPFKDHAFDKIVFSEVLEHLDNDRAAIKELYRVLKPGGCVGLTVPNSNYPFLWDPLNWTRERLGLGHFNPKNTILGGVWSYDHKRLYSPEAIKKLAEEGGFRVSKIDALTHYCLPANYLILRLGKLFYTRLPIPSKAKKALEKFEWDETDDKSFSPTKTALEIFQKFDEFNDRHLEPNKSSISISLKLEK